MRIIIPMAGIGKRMRPHTLTVPKPLINIAGKPIVQRLVEDIGEILNKKIEEIAFVIGDFGREVEQNLLSIAKEVGTKGKIYYQKEALGTSHAIYCANDSIKGEVIVAFADTLFKVNSNQLSAFSKQINANSKKLKTDIDATIWVHKVKDPGLYGVVITDKNNIIKDFIEKPKNRISDLAIIGIYYFKDGENFRNELKHQIDNKIMKSGEYQLTDALQTMMRKGKIFSTAEVDEWLDCGNKDSTVYTNQRILEFNKTKDLIAKSVSKRNSIIIPPCYLGEKVEINDSIVGPYVSIGSNSKIDRSVISNSIIQSNSKISCVTIENSMIGNFVDFKGELNEVSIGDYTTLD